MNLYFHLNKWHIFPAQMSMQHSLLCMIRSWTIRSQEKYFSFVFLSIFCKSAIQNDNFHYNRTSPIKFHLIVAKKNSFFNDSNVDLFLYDFRCFLNAIRYKKRNKPFSFVCSSVHLQFWFWNTQLQMHDEDVDPIWAPCSYIRNMHTFKWLARKKANERTKRY